MPESKAQLHLLMRVGFTDFYVYFASLLISFTA